ncbi:MAG: hypothetical protein GY821_14955 [Gammaproteobacteria bacterium]|nr:hypothetical protein [Gammaproteobacteria bacterium]
METVTSIKDPRVVLARALQTTHERQTQHKCLLYGVEQIKWALQSAITIDYIFTEQTLPQFVDQQILQVSSGILKKISGTAYVVPCLAVATLPQQAQYNNDFLIVLDGVQDFGNIGSIIRTASGFSVNHFLLTAMQTDPYQRKVIDASRGLVFQSHFDYQATPQQTIKKLTQQGYQLVVTSPHAKNLQSQAPLSPAKPIALIIGNETHGVAEDFLTAADVAVQIPMSHSVESLNVGVAAGISIYELKFKQVLLMLKEKIFCNTGRMVNVTAKLMQRAFDHEIRQKTDFSGMQVILLMIMHCDGATSLAQISKDIALFDEELEQFLQPLRDNQLITADNDSYLLTPAGERFLAEIWPIVEQSQQKIFAEFNQQEQQELERLLTKLQQGCTKLLHTS